MGERRDPLEGLEPLTVTPPVLARWMGVPVPALEALEAAGTIPPRISQAYGARRVEFYYVAAVKDRLALASGVGKAGTESDVWLERLRKA